MGFIAKWQYSVHQIDKDEWRHVFPDEILKDIRLFKSIEDAFLGVIKHHYLCIYSGQKIVSILPCFEYRLNLDVLSSKKTQSIVLKIRKRFKNFYSVKVFVVGSYIATCEQYIGVRKEFSDSDLSMIPKEIEKKSKQLGCSIMMIKEVPAPQLSFVKRVFPEFTFVDSVPNSYIPTAPKFKPYPSMLSKKTRKRVKVAKQDFVKEGLRFEHFHDFQELSGIACDLYTHVLDKSPTKFEALNVAFFEKVNEYFATETFLMTIMDSENKIRSVELVFTCKNKLIPIYIGLDYSFKNVKCLYFNSIIHAIEHAEENGLGMVVAGQNSYFPKALSGAIIERCYLGFHSSKGFLSFVIKHFFRYLFPAFVNNAGVFYNQQGEDGLMDFCKEYGIEMLPDMRKDKN